MSEFHEDFEVGESDYADWSCYYKEGEEESVRSAVSPVPQTFHDLVIITTKWNRRLLTISIVLHNWTSENNICITVHLEGHCTLTQSCPTNYAIFYKSLLLVDYFTVNTPIISSNVSLIPLSNHLHGHYLQCYFDHRHLNNAWYSKTHSLFRKPYLAIISSNSAAKSSYTLSVHPSSPGRHIKMLNTQKHAHITMLFLSVNTLEHQGK